ncbi:MAG: DUF1990 domain-containing protein [Acidobacteriales bacterium]|nr:DUF1990 domain-containing protein [Terriglobales bacterium]
MRFRARAFHAREIQEFLRLVQTSSFSYQEVGATLSGEMPSDYNIDRNRQLLGRGCAVWEKAKEALRQSAMFDMPWIRLHRADKWIATGTVVAVEVKHFGFYSLNACRIIGLVDSSPGIERFGFSYGTLWQHAERGEERFCVEWNREHDFVTYDLLAFSQPRMLGARLAYPLSRNLQRRFAQESKLSMLRACS